MFDTLLQLYKLGGRNAVKRAMSPSSKWVQRVCDRTGADFELAIEERNEWLEELLEFFDSLVDKDFEDPD